MTILTMLRAALEHGPHAELLAQIDVEAQVTCAADAAADEHMAVFDALIATLSHDDEFERREERERQSVVERFEKVPRANYLYVWRRAGHPFGTRLYRAAGWELRARDSDRRFADAVGSGAIAGIPDERFIKRPMGLTALLHQVEEDWRQAHLRMLGQEKKDKLAHVRDDAREREWQAQQAVAA